jgi:hypothetical protein
MSLCKSTSSRWLCCRRLHQSRSRFVPFGSAASRLPSHRQLVSSSARKISASLDTAEFKFSPARRRPRCSFIEATTPEDRTPLYHPARAQPCSLTRHPSPVFRTFLLRSFLCKTQSNPAPKTILIPSSSHHDRVIASFALCHSSPPPLPSLSAWRQWQNPCPREQT